MQVLIETVAVVPIKLIFMRFVFLKDGWVSRGQRIGGSKVRKMFRSVRPSLQGGVKVR
jgi:hypothetical protein